MRQAWSFSSVLLVLGILSIGGCGGAGGLTDGRAHSGTFRLALGGGQGGRNLARAELTVNKIELKAVESAEYVTYWQGVKDVDLLSPNPAVIETLIDLGDDPTQVFDSVRLHFSRVSLLDGDGEEFDGNTDLTLTVPARLRVDGNRVVHLNLVLLHSRIMLEDGVVSIDIVGVLEDNGAGDGGYVDGSYGDVYFLDLSYVGTDITLPGGEVATGLWFSGDFFGLYKEDDASGGRLWLFDGLEGTFEYSNPAKDEGTWEIGMPSIDWTGWTMTGTFRSYQKAIRPVPNTWLGVLVSCNAGGRGDFSIMRFNAQGNLVELAAGPVEFDDPENPEKGASFVLTPIEHLFEPGPKPEYHGRLSFMDYDQGRFTLTGESGTLPRKGTWRSLIAMLLQ